MRRLLVIGMACGKPLRLGNTGPSGVSTVRLRSVAPGEAGREGVVSGTGVAGRCGGRTGFRALRGESMESGRSRGITAGLCGTLGILLIFAAALLGYLTRSFFNERAFAARVAESLKNPDFANYVS